MLRNVLILAVAIGAVSAQRRVAPASLQYSFSAVHQPAAWSRSLQSRRPARLLPESNFLPTTFTNAPRFEAPTPPPANTQPEQPTFVQPEPKITKPQTIVEFTAPKQQSHIPVMIPVPKSFPANAITVSPKQLRQMSLTDMDSIIAKMISNAQASTNDVSFSFKEVDASVISDEPSIPNQEIVNNTQDVAAPSLADFDDTLILTTEPTMEMISTTPGLEEIWTETIAQAIMNQNIEPEMATEQSEQEIVNETIEPEATTIDIGSNPEELAVTEAILPPVELTTTPPSSNDESFQQHYRQFMDSWLTLASQNLKRSEIVDIFKPIYQSYLQAPVDVTTNIPDMTTVETLPMEAENPVVTEMAQEQPQVEVLAVEPEPEVKVLMVQEEPIVEVVPDMETPLEPIAPEVKAVDTTMSPVEDLAIPVEENLVGSEIMPESVAVEPKTSNVQDFPEIFVVEEAALPTEGQIPAKPVAVKPTRTEPLLLEAVPLVTPAGLVSGYRYVLAHRV